MKPATPRRLLRAGAALALAAAALAPTLTAAQASAAPAPDVAFRFTDTRIAESSGLAVSAAEPDYVFTVNDSGPTRVFGVTPSNGRSAATLRLDNADNVDWEAIAAGTGRSLWVGDIGDNKTARNNVTVYRFKLPPRLRTGHYGASASYRLAYPDGPHDAETLLVNPQTQAMYVVTKNAKGGALYKVPRDLGAGRNEMTKAGKMPPLITDGAFRPDGKQYVLRSYTTGYVYSTDGKQIASFPLPKQKQGEGVAYTANGKSLLLTSEGARSDVLRFDLSKVLANASKSPSAAKSPSPSKTDAAGGGGIDVVNTLFVAGPFVIALFAAAIAFLLHRRRLAPSAAGSHGGRGSRRERRYERDEPHPPPPYGAPFDVEEQDDGWPVPPSHRADQEPPPSFQETGPPTAAYEPTTYDTRNGRSARRENGGPPPPADSRSGRGSAQGRRGSSRSAGQGRRRRGGGSDDGEPFWLRE